MYACAVQVGTTRTSGMPQASFARNSSTGVIVACGFPRDAGARAPPPPFTACGTEEPLYLSVYARTAQAGTMRA